MVTVLAEIPGRQLEIHGAMGADRVFLKNNGTIVFFSSWVPTSFKCDYN